MTIRSPFRINALPNRLDLTRGEVFTLLDTATGHAPTLP